MKIRLNKDLRGFKSGTIIDFDNALLDKYWINRVKDSAYDYCVSIITETSEKEEKVKTMNKKTRSKNGD